MSKQGRIHQQFPLFHRDPFTPELHAVVEKTIKEVNNALVQRKLPPLPTHLYNYHTDSENSISEETYDDYYAKSSQSQNNQNAQKENSITRAATNSNRYPSEKLNKSTLGDAKSRGSNLIKSITGKGGSQPTTEGEKVLKLYPWMKSK